MIINIKKNREKIMKGKKTKLDYVLGFVLILKRLQKEAKPYKGITLTIFLSIMLTSIIASIIINYLDIKNLKGSKTGDVTIEQVLMIIGFFFLIYLSAVIPMIVKNIQLKNSIRKGLYVKTQLIGAFSNSIDKTILNPNKQKK